MASKTPVLDGPDDFKLYYHTNDEGHVWLNAKNSPILLTEPLVGHIPLHLGFMVYLKYTKLTAPYAP